MAALFFSLILTCILEGIGILLIRKTALWFRASLLCNLLTNPLANVLVSLIRPWLADEWILYIAIFLLEISIVFAETALYGLILNTSRRKAFHTSLLCNAGSFVLGLLLW